MRKDFIRQHFNTEHKPAFVEYGYGQVEPNHLSAQRTGQTYAQLPANKDIEVLQQGQFVKYDYAREEVNFGGDTNDGLPAAPGEWMLVFNEIKLYRDNQMDCEFAMIRDNYQARIYSPYDYARSEEDKQALHYNGGPDVVVKPAVYEEAKNFETGKTYYTFADDEYTEATGVTAENFNDGTYYLKTPKVSYSVDDVTAPVDPYEIDYTEDPFHFLGRYWAKKMPEGTTMVPRVFKTNIGDIYTTNTIDEDVLGVGDILGVGADQANNPGILVVDKKADGTTGTKAARIGANDTMRWQVVRVYTMPDNQPGVKIMRIA